jgi:hypothetical protein
MLVGHAKKLHPYHHRLKGFKSRIPTKPFRGNDPGRIVARLKSAFMNPFNTAWNNDVPQVVAPVESPAANAKNPIWDHDAFQGIAL